MRILIAYDGSMYSDIAVNDLRLAGLPEIAEVVVLSVLDMEGGGIAESVCLRLQKWFPEWQLSAESRWGSPAEIILEKAKGWPADLVVLGTHGRSAPGRLLLGSVSSRVINEAPCSVRVARLALTDQERPLRILIGNDGSSEAEAIIDELTKRSWPAGTEVRVAAAVEVLTPAGFDDSMVSADAFADAEIRERERGESIVRHCRGKLELAGLSTSTVVEEGDAANFLIREAEDWKAHAIFVGSRGLSRTQRLLLGSVSKAVVTRAPCTVEVVRQR